jgi:hypothetical protein
VNPWKPGSTLAKRHCRKTPYDRTCSRYVHLLCGHCGCNEASVIITLKLTASPTGVRGNPVGLRMQRHLSSALSLHTLANDRKDNPTYRR